MGKHINVGFIPGKNEYLKPWNIRDFRLYINGKSIHGFPADVEFLSLKDNIIFLKVLVASNLFDISEKFNTIKLSFPTGNEEKLDFFASIDHSDVFEIEKVGDGIPIIGLKLFLKP